MVETEVRPKRIDADTVARPHGLQRRARRAALPISLLLCLSLFGCASDAGEQGGTSRPGAAPPSAAPDDAYVRATRIAKLPVTLTGLTSAADGSELLVADRTGRVRRLTRPGADGLGLPTLEETPVLDLHTQVSLLGERGFFALSVTPDGKSLVVSYTRLDGAIELVQYPYSPGAPISPDTGRTIVDIPAPYAWHHGGGFAFDRDGNLLLGVGDLEFRNLDPPGPQDPDLLLGSVLRVPAEVLADPDSDWTAGPDDLIAKGLRNPWRVSVDADTGDLWIGEVGLDRIEEVNRVAADDIGKGVANFGWPYLEGTLTGVGTAPTGARLLDPVLERAHDDGVCGIVGGPVYRGQRLPELVGRYLYSDLCDPDVRALTIDAAGSVLRDEVVGAFGEPVTSFGVDADGGVYGLGASGSLFRLDPSASKAEESDQGTDIAEVTATSVPRSRENCDGVVAALRPLSDMAGLRPEALEAAFGRAQSELAELVPSLPEYIANDGVVVQQAIVALGRELAKASWDTASPAMAQARADLLAGSGIFVGFPESMARIVDSECG